MSKELSDINETILQLNETVYEKMKHIYLNEYVQIPTIDNDKANILYAILKNSNHPNYKKIYISILLVDLALTLHEQVPISNPSSEDAKKKTQLTVLAGDFYSSLYYEALSSVNALEEVNAIAQAIQYINVKKMDYTFETFDQLDDLLSCVKKIESHLYTKIANHFGQDDMINKIEDLYLYKRLLAENHLDEQGGQSVLIDKIEKFESFDIVLQQMKDSLFLEFKDGSAMSSIFQERLEELRPHQEKVMEEG